MYPSDCSLACDCLHHPSALAGLHIIIRCHHLWQSFEGSIQEGVIFFSRKKCHPNYVPIETECYNVCYAGVMQLLQPTAQR